jgi:hypothetical protein
MCTLDSVHLPTTVKAKNSFHPSQNNIRNAPSLFNVITLSLSLSEARVQAMAGEQLASCQSPDVARFPCNGVGLEATFERGAFSLKGRKKYRASAMI